MIPRDEHLVADIRDCEEGAKALCSQYCPVPRPASLARSHQGSLDIAWTGTPLLRIPGRGLPDSGRRAARHSGSEEVHPKMKAVLQESRGIERLPSRALRPTAASPLGIVRALSGTAKLPDLKIPN